MKTYNEIYLTTRNILRQRSVENYSFEAKQIVSKAAGKTTSELMRDLGLYTSDEIEERVAEYTARRLRGEPLAYICGGWEFYGLPMVVTPDVLIPRIDSEILVDTAKEMLTGHKMDARVLDLCCGSGCLTCAIAHEMPATRFLSIDVSTSALEICRKNVALNRLNTRVICMQADALSAPPLGLGKFDMIVCNPPYVPTYEILELDSSVKDYEPIWALDGGEDGLKFYRSVIKYWKIVLKNGGLLLFEVGEGQAEPVSEMLLAAGFTSVQTRQDTAGTERVVVARISESEQ